jgi:hypothetical protein
MIDPYSATAILAAFLVIWGVIIPVCGVIPKVKEVISLRYMIVVVFLAATIGVIIDFSALDDATRNTVIIGGAILSGLFILVRSLEKALYNGWLGSQRINAHVEKGDIKAGVEIDPNPAKENK